MAEGTDISEEMRKRDRTRDRRESFVSKFLRRIVAPFGLGQPDDIVKEGMDAGVEDEPLEDTPEAELQQLEAEQAMMRNPEHPGEQMSGTL